MGLFEMAQGITFALVDDRASDARYQRRLREGGLTLRLASGPSVGLGVIGQF
jgi:hypothetical protein